MSKVSIVYGTTEDTRGGSRTPSPEPLVPHGIAVDVTQAGTSSTSCRMIRRHHHCGFGSRRAISESR